MKMSEMFETVLNELKVGDTARMVSSRRNEIAKALNKDFRSLEIGRASCRERV